MEDQINNTALTSSNISNRAAAGEESLNEMNISMKKITDSSKQMTNIVGMINDISEQINLLSLNAAIEAARAGHAGKGFAVVADEISKLADATSKSIKDITTLITSNNNEIKKGMSSALETIDIISNIIKDIGNIGNQVETISQSMKDQLETNNTVNTEVIEVKNRADFVSTATSEQKIAIAEVAKSIQSITELTQSNATGSEEMASSSEEIAAMAESLKSKIEFFKVD
jgi:methyl-accepting chemotaxis protein